MNKFEDMNVRKTSVMMKSMISKIKDQKKTQHIIFKSQKANCHSTCKHSQSISERPVEKWTTYIFSENTCKQLLMYEVIKNMTHTREIHTSSFEILCSIYQISNDVKNIMRRTLCLDNGVGQFSYNAGENISCYSPYGEKFGNSCQNYKDTYSLKKRIYCQNYFLIMFIINCHLLLIASTCNNFNVHRQETN